jgi:hypothetical protein
MVWRPRAKFAVVALHDPATSPAETLASDAVQIGVAPLVKATEPGVTTTSFAALGTGKLPVTVAEKVTAPG